MLQFLHEEYSLTFPPLSINRYSFIQMSELGRRAENKTSEALKQQQQRGIEPRLSRLRVLHSTAELLAILPKQEGLTYTVHVFYVDYIHESVVFICVRLCMCARIYLSPCTWRFEPPLKYMTEVGPE